MSTRTTPEQTPREPLNSTAYGLKWSSIPGKRGFLLLPRRWVVEHFFAWTARFRKLARDYERLPQTLKGIYFIAFAILMTSRLIKLATS